MPGLQNKPNAAFICLVCGLASFLSATLFYFLKGSDLAGGLSGIFLLSLWLVPLIVGYVVMSEASSDRTKRKGPNVWLKRVSWLVFAFLTVDLLNTLSSLFLFSEPPIPDWVFHPFSPLFEMLLDTGLVNETLLFIALAMSVPLALCAAKVLRGQE